MPMCTQSGSLARANSSQIGANSDRIKAGRRRYRRRPRPRAQTVHFVRAPQSLTLIAQGQKAGPFEPRRRVCIAGRRNGCRREKAPLRNPGRPSCARKACWEKASAQSKPMRSMSRRRASGSARVILPTEQCSRLTSAPNSVSTLRGVLACCAPRTKRVRLQRSLDQPTAVKLPSPGSSWMVIGRGRRAR